MPTVVIIGRKNVGKSTIFNRLTGMRLSIVSKEPGVTRDRIYGDVEWQGRQFTIIDTGGFFPAEKHGLTHKINEQIMRGIDEAHLIYFVVDGKAGLKPSDEDIAQYARRAHKPVFLLVNKLDNRKDEIKALEFMKFGFTPVFCVSAEGGTGFGEVLDSTIAKLPELPRQKHRKLVRVAILGRPNAGKSTLLNSITEQERAIVDEAPGTTRDLVHARFSFNGIDMEIVGTCGLRKKPRVKSSIEFYSIIRTARVLDLIDIAVLIFDTTEGIVDQDRRIASLVMSKAKSLVIVPNKTDLIDKKNAARIVPSTRMSFKSYEFVPIVPISARDGIGIRELLMQIITVYQESIKHADKEVLNSLHLSLNSPTRGSLLHLRQIKTKPPVFRATLTTRVGKNYLDYLRSSLRHYFGFTGVPILIRTRVVRRRTIKGGMSD
jgi:GTP-binding protein